MDIKINIDYKIALMIANGLQSSSLSMILLAACISLLSILGRTDVSVSPGQ